MTNRGSSQEPDAVADLAGHRTPAERDQARLRYLAEAGSILGSSLDVDSTLAELGRAVVPALADWYAVDLVDEDGRITNIALAHVDPRKVELARSLRRRFPPSPDAPTGVEIGRAHV